jgi:hypothetical protein
MSYTESLPRIVGHWTAAEDALLIEQVAAKGPRRWSAIAEHVDGRTGKQCRERWHNHLDSKIDNGPWTLEEDLVLVEEVGRLGRSWAAIAKMLPGRTDNSVKNRYNARHRPRAGTPPPKRRRAASPPPPRARAVSPRTVRSVSPLTVRAGTKRAAQRLPESEESCLFSSLVLEFDDASCRRQARKRSLELLPRETSAAQIVEMMDICAPLAISSTAAAPSYTPPPPTGADRAAGLHVHRVRDVSYTRGAERSSAAPPVLGLEFKKSWPGCAAQDLRVAEGMLQCNMSLGLFMF